MVRRINVEDFDVREASFQLTGILKRMVEDECSYFFQGKRFNAELSTEAMWIMDGVLFSVIRKRTKMGSALIGYTNLVITVANDSFTRSFEYLTVSELWHGYIAGQLSGVPVDYDKPSEICWFNLNPKDSEPKNLAEIQELGTRITQIWIA